MKLQKKPFGVLEVAGLLSLYDTWRKYVGAIWGTPKI